MAAVLDDLKAYMKAEIEKSLEAADCQETATEPSV